MDKNSHQGPIVIGPTHTRTHTLMGRETCSHSLTRYLSLFLAACKLRKCNVAVQNNNGNCVPTVQKSMCSQAPAHFLSLSLSLARLRSRTPSLPRPKRGRWNESNSKNESSKSNNTKQSRTAAWLLALLSSSIEHTLNANTITEIKEPMEQSQQPGANNGPNQREKERWSASGRESESARAKLLSPR